MHVHRRDVTQSVCSKGMFHHFYDYRCIKRCSTMRSRLCEERGVFLYVYFILNMIVKYIFIYGGRVLCVMCVSQVENSESNSRKHNKTIKVLKELAQTVNSSAIVLQKVVLNTNGADLKYVHRRFQRAHKHASPVLPEEQCTSTSPTMSMCTRRPQRQRKKRKATVLLDESDPRLQIVRDIISRWKSTPRTITKSEVSKILGNLQDDKVLLQTVVERLRDVVAPYVTLRRWFRAGRDHLNREELAARTNASEAQMPVLPPVRESSGRPAIRTAGLYMC